MLKKGAGIGLIITFIVIVVIIIGVILFPIFSKDSSSEKPAEIGTAEESLEENVAGNEDNEIVEKPLIEEHGNASSNETAVEGNLSQENESVVSGLSDLIVDSLDVIVGNKSIKVGNETNNYTNTSVYGIDITVEVKNIGGVDAAASSTRFFNTGDEGSDVFSASTAAITAGQSTSLEQSFEVEGEGIYSVVVNVDWTSLIEESNESNNEFGANYIVD